MSAVIKVHTHDCVSGLKNGKLNSHIGLSARMGLYVGIIAAEQLFCTLDCKIFNNIYASASAVISLCGISFGIFICKDASHCSHYGFGYPVFRSDKFDVAVLSCLFVRNRSGNLRVYLFYFFQRIHKFISS